MLSYFSSVIREEFPANHPLLSNQWPTYAYQAPVAVRLIGGSPTAVQDLVDWMGACCQQNTIVELRSVIRCPARYVLAMDGVRRLGIDILLEEIPQLLNRLRHELFDHDTVRQIFAAGQNLPPELAQAICHCIARYFYHGSLPEVDKWLHLATMNLMFDDGVKTWLTPGVLNEGPDTIDAWNLWNSKNARSYPARWHQPPFAGPSLERIRPPAPYHSGNFTPHFTQQYPPWGPPHHPPPAESWTHPPFGHNPLPPPPPPKPDAYRNYVDHNERGRSRSRVPAYTMRCNYCQQVHPEVAGAPHQCTSGHAYTVSSTPSPPRGRSVSRSYSRHHRRSQDV